MDDEKNLTAAFIIGFLFGPFGYLYVYRWQRMVFMLFVSIILIWLFTLIIAPLLWFVIAFDCYSIAREINIKLERGKKNRIKKNRNKETPIEIIKKQYAEGKISRKEFIQRKKDLAES